MGRKRKSIKRGKNRKTNQLNELFDMNKIQFNPKDFSIIKIKNQAQLNSEFFGENKNNFPQLFTPIKPINGIKVESTLKTPNNRAMHTAYQNQDQFATPIEKFKNDDIQESAKKNLMDSNIKNILQYPMMNSIEKLLHSEEKQHNDQMSSQEKEDNKPIISIPKFTPNLIKNQNGYLQEAPTIPINKSGCNCKNSQCLKLYCDCFSNQRVCQEHCNCKNCGNFKNSKKRSKAIEQVQKKTPSAFQPKFLTKKVITKNKGSQQAVSYKMNFLHKQGCNCKNSQCQKRYCECFQLGLNCTMVCNCSNCLNHKFEGKNVENELIENVYEVSTPIDLKQELKKKLLEIKLAKFSQKSKNIF